MCFRQSLMQQTDNRQASFPSLLRETCNTHHGTRSIALCIHITPFTAPVILCNVRWITLTTFEVKIIFVHELRSQWFQLMFKGFSQFFVGFVFFDVILLWHVCKKHTENNSDRLATCSGFTLTLIQLLLVRVPTPPASLSNPELHRKEYMNKNIFLYIEYQLKRMSERTQNIFILDSSK